MNETKRKYRAKCKRRYVEFYPNEIELYNKSKSINFSKFVKDNLRKE